MEADVFIRLLQILNCIKLKKENHCLSLGHWGSFREQDPFKVFHWSTSPVLLSTAERGHQDDACKSSFQAQVESPTWDTALDVGVQWGDTLPGLISPGV